MASFNGSLASAPNGVLGIGSLEQCAQNLAHRQQDRRKTAARDIEVWARQLFNQFNQRWTHNDLHAEQHAHAELESLVQKLIDGFCHSPCTQRRKGGLIGLASLAIALNQQQLKPHVAKLVSAVLTCFSDEDRDVRYDACEAFYNIAKVARGEVLKQFEPVFDGLSRLASDVDIQVLDGSRCLNRLVQDIATETREFHCWNIITILTTRVHVLNPQVRTLVLGWFLLLDSVPEVDMMANVPLYLEGLFGFLAGDDRQIKKYAEKHLNDLLCDMKARKDFDKVQRAIADAAPIVAECCRTGEKRPEDNYVRLVALGWLHEFIKLQESLDAAAAQLECPPTVPDPHPSGSYRMTGGLCLGQSAQHARMRLASSPRGTEERSEGSCGLKDLLPVLLQGVLHCVDDDENEIRREAERANDVMIISAETLGSNLPVEALVDVLLAATKDDPGSRLMLVCFAWIELLLERCPDEVLRPPVRNRLRDPALAALRHREYGVVSEALRLIAKLEQHDRIPSQIDASTEIGDLFNNVCQRFFEMMLEEYKGEATAVSEESSLLGPRGELIVRELCRGIDAERFFSIAAAQLASESDAQFAGQLVWMLNRVLLTSFETRALRKRLLDAALSSPPPVLMSPGVETPALAFALLEAWCHCPVSTLALCLWLHWFELADEVVVRMASVDISVKVKHQLLEFAEYFESPVFMRVRLQLLEARKHPKLLRAILGLAALLPQDHPLNARLSVVETGLLLDRIAPFGARGHIPLPTPLAPEVAQPLERFDEMIREQRLCECIL